jgi:hydro-lyases, Fe-S type, tartrate/fumarate subfamily, alpha region
MRTVKAEEITNAIRDMCIEANIFLPKELEDRIRESSNKETNEVGKALLRDICENMTAAKEMNIPVCQDTGMAVIFAEIGQELHIEGDFEKAVNEGVRRGYAEGYLRASVVSDPLKRINSNDNTPAILHVRLVSGDKIKLMVAPKGFGSENMSNLKMMNPSADEEDIINHVKECVLSAGSNPCPPVVIGVGIGGDFEYCAYLAKKALCRDISEKNPDEFYSKLEGKILKAVNETGIGPQGFGGDITALAVMVETYPTHIAGLPVAVNMGCHVTRHKSVII